MEKIWSDDAWDDYIYWQGQDKKTLKYRDGYSRRIDEKNRIVYDVVDGKLHIVSCRDHYED